MNKNLSKIAKELFDKIRSQFPTIQIGNEDAEIIDDPSEARYFEFDYKNNGVSLGAVTISIDEDDGLVVMYSNDIVDKQPDGVRHYWYNFLREMRAFAKRRLLNFEIRDILKSLDKKDYQFLSNNRGDKKVTESKLWGTNKTSYQNVDEARIVVKHYKPINGELPQGRTHGIDSIYIENTQGERFKYPYKHLNGARAMARHVANGGNPYDGIGTHITGLSEELATLRMFKGYVGRNPVVSEAMDTVQSKVSDRMDEIKKQIHQLQGQNYYQTFTESFTEDEYQEIPEEIMKDWVDKLTIRVFNEDLTSAFPFIYKLMNNTKITELSANDIIEAADEEVMEDSTFAIIDELAEYENFVDSILEDEDLASNPQNDDEVVTKLNELFAQELPVGADGTNAIESLSGIVDDQELFDVLKEVSDISPEADAREYIKSYFEIKDQEDGTDIASKLTIGSAEPTAAPEDQSAAEIAATPPEGNGAPAPAQPAAESVTKFAKIVERAKKAGMKLSDTLQYKGRDITLKDAIIMSGLNINEFFKDNTDDDHKQVVEFVKSMYDFHTGTFPKGETGVILAVEKQFGKPATKMAAESIKSLRGEFESKRIKQLAGI